MSYLVNQIRRVTQVVFLVALQMNLAAAQVTPPSPAPAAPVAGTVNQEIPVAPATGQNTAVPALPVQPSDVPVAPAVPATPVTALPLTTPLPSPSPSPVIAVPNPSPSPSPNPSPVTISIQSPTPGPAQPTPADQGLDSGPGLEVVTPETAKYQAAISTYQDKRYLPALRIMAEFARDYPTSGRREEVIYLMGDCYRNLNLESDAIATYKYEVARYPGGHFLVNAELFIGELEFHGQQYKEAEAAFTVAMNKGEGDIRSAGIFNLASCLIADPKVIDKTLATQMLKKLAQDPDGGVFSGKAALNLAQQDDLAGNFTEALTYWELALKLCKDPAEQAQAATRGGLSALQGNDMNVAVGLLTRALAMDATTVPDKQVANSALLRIAFQQKDYEKWLKIYNANPTLILEENKAEIAFDLGQAKFSTKDWPGTVAAMDTYFKDYPQASVTPLGAYAAYEELLAKLDQHTPSMDTASLIQAYLKNFPSSPYTTPVSFLLAQELTDKQRFSEALPIWKDIAADAGKPGSTFTAADLSLGLAQAYLGLESWAAAADNFQTYLDELGKAGSVKPQVQVYVLSRIANCYQKSGEIEKATSAWHKVLVAAPAGSQEEQVALEQLGLIYSSEKDDTDKRAAVGVFTQLLDQFPKTNLRPLAEFTIGDGLFREEKYNDAEIWLQKARLSDPALTQPATERLALCAFGLRSAEQTESYVQEYEAIPPPAGQTQADGKPALPVELYFWLADEEQKRGLNTDAERNYATITSYTGAAPAFTSSAWLRLAQVQLKRKEYSPSVESYKKFRTLSPTQADDTEVLLGLAQASLGAGLSDAADELALQALREEPEGANSAKARILLGDICDSQKKYQEAAKQFATVAILFDDPSITPVAMHKAALAFGKAGDIKSAGEWADKLHAKYPNFQVSTPN